MNLSYLFPLLLLAIPWCAGAQTKENLSPEEIVERYTQAMGGKKAWEKVKNMQVESEIVANNETRSYSLRIFEAPNKSREELIRKGKKVVKVFDGSSGWVFNPFDIADKFREMKPEEVATAIEGEFPEALMFYKERGHKIELLESTEQRGGKAYQIMLTNAKTKGKTLYFIDQANFVLVMVIAYPSDPKFPGTSYLFGNFKKVKGKLVPFIITTEYQDEIQAVSTVKKVVFDVKLDDNCFSVPK